MMTMIARSSFFLVIVAMLYSLYHDKEATKNYYTEKLKVAEQTRDSAIEAINKFNVVQEQLVVLNKETQEKLNVIKNENDALSIAINNGTKRMYAISSALSASTSNKTSEACGLGNGTSIELPRDIATNILNIQRGIAEDRQKIKYLQGYIKKIDKMFEETD